MKEGTEYRYYESGDEFAQESIRAAQELSRYRLNTPLGDVDYLAYKARKPIIEKWFEGIDGRGLSALDVGGRIQPYRPLLERYTEQYVAVDLQLAGLLDVVATAECLPFGENTFDMVLCFAMLNYVPNPNLAIKEMHRVLRPGGRLFLSTFSLFPEHHDDLWRFLPGGLHHLTRDFSRVEIRPEGYSAVGLLRAINVTLHRDLKNPWVLRIARRTTIPIFNLVGLLLDIVAAPNTRSTAAYSLMAIK